MYRPTDFLGAEIKSPNFLHCFCCIVLVIAQHHLLKIHLVWILCMAFFLLATRTLYRNYSLSLPIQRAQTELPVYALL